MPSALLALLDAEATGDAATAERAARALETIGARHRAALAYRLAEELHLAAGRPGHARRCVEQAERLVAPGSLVTAGHRPPIRLDPPIAVEESAPLADISGLTKRELEISRLVAQGLSNQEIANRLFLSVRTVESHVLQARTKLGAARRRDLGRLVTSRQDGA
ncbi:LuxR C-terminal-related transcriptional regulator [Plantibacter flavus]